MHGSPRAEDISPGLVAFARKGWKLCAKMPLGSLRPGRWNNRAPALKRSRVSPARGPRLGCQKTKREFRRDAFTAAENEGTIPERPRGDRADDRVVVHLPPGDDNVNEASLDHDDHAAAVTSALQLPLETLAFTANATHHVAGRLALDNRPVWQRRQCQVAGFQSAALEAPPIGEILLPRMLLRFSGIDGYEHVGRVIGLLAVANNPNWKGVGQVHVSLTSGLEAIATPGYSALKASHIEF